MADRSKAAGLLRHPASRDGDTREIRARVSRADGAMLAFEYVLKGSLHRLKIPPPGKPRPANRLWRRTCFEAFVAVKEKPEYCEFNFAPSREWAVYAFAKYREPVAMVENARAPTIVVRREGDVLELAATVALPSIIDPCARLKLALSAVIEDERGELSYWALAHPPGPPDFHHPEAFTLEMEPQ